MGVITVEVPQRIKQNYRIDSKIKAEELIDSLDRLGTKKKILDLSDIVGLWADRKESGEEISRELRRKSNSRVKNG